jgi:hypothetical protein
VVSQRIRSKLLGHAGGSGFVEAPGPDAQVLSNHVVNVGNNGRLSRTGKFISSKTQIDNLFAEMNRTHAAWASEPRRIVLYAHGGLNAERSGLDIAQRQRAWWLRNHVYPITFAWETGANETLQDQLSDLVGRKVPTGVTFNLFEQVDRVIEKTARRTLRWIWDEMKQNAAGASEPLPANWRDRSDRELPGASVFVAGLLRYLEETADVATEIHLVGHSAGAIFLTGILEQLEAAGVPVTSLTYLAAALRTDEWMHSVLPALEHGHVQRFTAFGLNPARELDDVCGPGGLAIYRKSLLYLVSRALERPNEPFALDVPLVGMAHFAESPVSGASFADAVASLPDARLVWAPSATTADSRSDAGSHGGFDDDSATMTSVLLRILRSTSVAPGNEYAPNLPTERPQVGVGDIATSVADRPPELVTVDVRAMGGAPRMITGEPTETRTESAIQPEPAVPGSGNRAVNALLRAGGRVRRGTTGGLDSNDAPLEEAG